MVSCPCVLILCLFLYITELLSFRSHYHLLRPHNSNDVGRQSLHSVSFFMNAAACAKTFLLAYCILDCVSGIDPNVSQETPYPRTALMAYPSFKFSICGLLYIERTPKFNGALMESNWVCRTASYTVVLPVHQNFSYLAFDQVCTQRRTNADSACAGLLFGSLVLVFNFLRLLNYYFPLLPSAQALYRVLVVLVIYIRNQTSYR